MSGHKCEIMSNVCSLFFLSVCSSKKRIGYLILIFVFFNLFSVSSLFLFSANGACTGWFLHIFGLLLCDIVQIKSYIVRSDSSQTTMDSYDLSSYDLTSYDLWSYDLTSQDLITYDSISVDTTCQEVLWLGMLTISTTWSLWFSVTLCGSHMISYVFLRLQSLICNSYIRDVDSDYHPLATKAYISYWF